MDWDILVRVFVQTGLNNSGQTDTALLHTKLAKLVSEEMQVCKVQDQVDEEREVTGMTDDEEDIDVDEEDDDVNEELPDR